MVFIFILLASANGFCAEIKLSEYSQQELTQKQTQDLKSVILYRHGLASILEYVKIRDDIFPARELKKSKILNKELRDEAVAIWKSLLDYFMAIDSVAELHKDFFKLKSKKNQTFSFNISRVAILAEYRFAIEFITAAEKNPALDTLFNEAVPDLGLPQGVYKDLKYRFLNIRKAGEFTAYEAVARYFGPIDDIELAANIEADRKKVWAAGKDNGTVLTLKNGLNILKKARKKAWFPVQKGVSNWMGNTKVYRKGKYLITLSQIKKNEHLLSPGDILLERREWYLTNVGIPGFWSHAALYIGSPEQRKNFFNDPETLAWVSTMRADTFEELLNTKYPATYKHCLTHAKNGYRPRVIEAIAKGVVFTTLEYSAACDSLAVLRPRLSKKEIAHAIFRAFEYYGRPYDYDFDFLTENSLVCSELVYKAYEPGKETRGLILPLERVMGHMITPVNAFARQFAINFGTDAQQTDLVLFIDGYEKKKYAKKGTLATFMESWKRPKWHVLMKKK